MTLDSKRISGDSSPGQFITIKCTDGLLFRRPFSIANTVRDRLEVIYKVLGKGTTWLSNRKPGSKLDVLGPLGNGFDLDSASYTSVLVAGGTGIASLIYLSKKIKPGILFYGTKTKQEIIHTDDFKNWDVRITTEDGSRAEKGLITDALARFLKKRKISKPHIYACGPKIMLQKIISLSKKDRIPCQVSIEDIMACGVGACRGCVIQTKDGYMSVCNDGPVFNGSDINL